MLKLRLAVLLPMLTLAAPAAAEPVPLKPGPKQRRATGNPPVCAKGQVVLFGACYIPADARVAKPPCPEPTLEYEGRCYFAVMAPPKASPTL